ncbi:MAG: TonB-dependent receptor [Acidobacteriota bacterium]
MSRLRRLFLCLLSAASLAAPLIAQQDDGDEAREPSEPTVIEDEVIVVGSKGELSRQELASSVGYFSEERLRDDYVLNVEDVFDRTANAFTGTTQFGAYSIRGVNNNGVAGSFSSANALASVVFNQSALGLNAGDYVKPSLFDVQSVEILRGPQSTVHGPNSLIGAVYINTRAAQLGSREGRFVAEAGELGTIRLGLVQNVDLIENVLAMRLVAERRLSDGDLINTTTGADDVQRTDELSVRLMSRYSPATRDDLLFDLTLAYNDSDSNAFAFSVPPPGGDLFDREQPYDVDDQYPSEMLLGTFAADWQISNAWQFRSVTSSNDFDLDQVFDADLTAFPFLEVTGFLAEEFFNQEFRLHYGDDRLDAFIGLYYSDGDYESGFFGTGLFSDGMGGIVPFNTTTASVEQIEQQALFGRLTWQLSDRLSATAGVRLNREKRTSTNFADNNGLISDLEASETFDQVIPSLSFTWALGDHTSVGVSYARGVQAGGIAFAVFLGQSLPYDEELTDNYELFLRYRSRNGRLIVNANLFSIDWFDQQVTSTLPGGFPGFDDIVLNAGESSIRGGELEIEWRARNDVGLFLSVGAADSEFEEFVLNGVDLAGLGFPQSPDLSIALGADYQNDAGWFAAGTFSWVDETYTEISDPDFTTISERHLLSARVGYAMERWRFYVWGRNLLDDEYEVGLFDGRTFGLDSTYGRLGDPRTVGAGVELSW